MFGIIYKKIFSQWPVQPVKGIFNKYCKLIAQLSI